MLDTVVVEKIKEVFKTMDYGQNIDSTDKADKWLKTMNITDQSGDIHNILLEMRQQKWDCTPQQKKSMLLKFAQEIENNCDFICQIEIQSRGILSKDTKKYLPMLVNYIEYYSNFCGKNDENKKFRKNSIVVAVFDDNNPLWMLGLVVGPALAAGCRVALQAGTKLAVATKFIIELAERVGIPEHTMDLIPSVEGNIQTYLDDKNVDMLSLFVDIFDPKYEATNKRLIPVLHFSSHNNPMIVFDDSDIDSAVDSVVDNAWGYQGMQPWAINKILIQESVFQKVTAKLKNKLSSVRIGNGNNKLADISFPNNPVVCSKLKQATEKAKSAGVEIFQTQENSINFTPTIFIGLNIETNNVIKGPEKNGAVTLLSFRSIDEAVNLANNSRQGFGASIWTENIGLANEVAKKLEVNNVWINSHGLISVESALLPLKDSGNAYFGGVEGFYEYLINIPTRQEVKNEVDRPSKLDQNVINTINSAKTAAVSWNKIRYLNRLKLLSTLCYQVERVFKNATEKLLIEYIEVLVKTIDLAMFQRTNYQQSSPYGGYDLCVTKKPKGVLVIKCGGPPDQEAILILTAILEGNAVLILTKSQCSASAHKKIIEEIYREISKKLPSGLLSVLPCTNETVMTAVSHKAVNGFYNVTSVSDDLIATLPLTESRTFYDRFSECEDIVSKVTVTKNIWSNIGQSITCSL